MTFSYWYKQFLLIFNKISQTFDQIGMLMMYSLPSVSLRYKHEIRPYIIPYALPLTQVERTKQLDFCEQLTIQGLFNWKCLHCGDGCSRALSQHLQAFQIRATGSVYRIRFFFFQTEL